MPQKPLITTLLEVAKHYYSSKATFDHWSGIAV